MTRDARRSLEDFTRSLRPPGDEDTSSDRFAVAAGQPAARSFGRLSGGVNAEPQAKPEGLPKGLVYGLEAMAVLALIALVVLGPAFYTCQRMKDEGLFFYGTTIRSCMRDRVSERSASAETYLRNLTGVR